MTIQERLRGMASQENHDGEPWDTMQEAAGYIGALEAALVEQEARLIASEGYAISREPTEDDRRLARIELEQSGILLNVNNVKNGSN